MIPQVLQEGSRVCAANGSQTLARAGAGAFFIAICLPSFSATHFEYSLVSLSCFITIHIYIYAYIL